jgi:starvation-inducible DNA-binding protein
MSKIHPTKNDLPEATRKELITLLNVELASAQHLALQAKQAHWNVKGPGFLQLHELFDRVYAAAVDWVDTIAERAVQLGGVAEGSLELIVKRSKLPAYGLELSAGREHVDAIANALALFAKSVRAAIDAAAKAGDADTADLFTEVSRGTDKMLWLVEAHLQAER